MKVKYVAGAEICQRYNVPKEELIAIILLNKIDNIKRNEITYVKEDDIIKVLISQKRITEDNVIKFYDNYTFMNTSDEDDAVEIIKKDTEVKNVKNTVIDDKNTETIESKIQKYNKLKIIKQLLENIESVSSLDDILSIYDSIKLIVITN